MVPIPTFPEVSILNLSEPTSILKNPVETAKVVFADCENNELLRVPPLSKSKRPYVVPLIVKTVWLLYELGDVVPIPTSPAKVAPPKCVKVIFVYSVIGSLCCGM